MRGASIARAGRVTGAIAAIAVFAVSPAAAQPAMPIDRADTAWMIVATALVLMMTLPGLALFYAGMVRKKNVLATMAQSLAATALCSILWAVVGYSLAFIGDAPFLGTFDRLLLSGMGLDAVSPWAKTIPEALFMIYQMTFAVITVALVAGSVADRMRFSAFLWFCRALVDCRLRADRALGLGRWFSCRGRAHRLRRRHGGAYQCRRCRPDRRTRAGCAPGLRQRKFSAATISRWR